MPSFNELSTSQLRQALQIREQIESLQQKLGSLLGGESSAGESAVKTGARRKGGKRTMSAEGRAKIRAAQQARWAKIKGKAATAKAAPAAKAPVKTAGKKRGGLTAEGRARLAAAMKARWAARKKGAPAPNASAQ